MTTSKNNAGLGYLVDAETGEEITRATPRECAASILAAEKDGGAGIIDHNGRRVYCDATVLRIERDAGVIRIKLAGDRALVCDGDDVDYIAT